MSSAATFALGMLIGGLGCQFTPSAVGDGDGGDGDAGDGDAGRCPWGARAFFDPCGLDSTDFTTTNDDVALSGELVYDTNAEAFVGAGPTFERRTLSLSGGIAHVWIARNFSIPAGSSLQVIGAAPLLIAAYGDIEIDGEIDVGSAWVDGAGGGNYEAGAGASVLDCIADAGMDSAVGGGGGGGGGFGSEGGNGGLGRSPIDDTNGGPGGVAISLGEIDGLRGGCGGGGGGQGQGNAAPAAPPGGALVLSAVGQVRVSGQLAASGAGGVGQLDGNRGGGSGGGSGGLIAIEGATLVVSGGFYANGGGGGGGANLLTMEDSEDLLVGQSGQKDQSAPARGGSGEALTPRGVGGDGAVFGIAATSGGGGERGGGGGGGGVGFILFISEDGTSVTGSPSASPQPFLVNSLLEPL